ncbi:MAG: hypothetical protein IIU56_03980 [Peptococcaceae bacterium]|nr:hypothetical protein [Peptococcaceae bacterium]MBQ5615561.1 hypothetical protein [Peptococcaceae bacterium]
MHKLTNYYALKGLKCIHLLATVLWCGGSLAAMLLYYTEGLSTTVETVLHTYLIRPGIWTLIATGMIYTLFTGFSCKQRWVRTKWIVTFATALSGVFIASVPMADLVKAILMVTLVVISVYHLPKNKVKRTV